jgi:hypothetical protein
MSKLTSNATYDTEMSTITKSEFERRFRTELAALMGIDTDDVTVHSVSSGSVVVAFSILVQESSNANSAMSDRLASSPSSLAINNVIPKVIPAVLVTFSWSFTDFPPCPTGCGLHGESSQTRAVMCADAAENVAAEESCIEVKADISRTCAATAACPTHRWGNRTRYRHHVKQLLNNCTTVQLCLTAV